MPKLQAPLANALDEPLSELQLQRIWQGAQSPLEPTWKRKRLQLTAAACLAAAVFVLFLLR